MKIISTLFLFCLFGLASGQTNKKETVAENYKTKQFNCAIFPSTYIDLPAIGSIVRFTPTHADIDKAELALKNKLALLVKDNPAVYKKLKQYRRQYIGFINEDGQKILIINCMRTKDEETSKDWLDKYIITLDGGSNYWTIYFNLDTDTLFNLNINGVS